MTRTIADHVATRAAIDAYKGIPGHAAYERAARDLDQPFEIEYRSTDAYHYIGHVWYENDGNLMVTRRGRKQLVVMKFADGSDIITTHRIEPGTEKIVETPVKQLGGGFTQPLGAEVERPAK